MAEGADGAAVGRVLDGDLAPGSEEQAAGQRDAFADAAQHEDLDRIGDDAAGRGEVVREGSAQRGEPARVADLRQAARAAVATARLAAGGARSSTETAKPTGPAGEKSNEMLPRGRADTGRRGYAGSGSGARVA